ncbi:MAG TPA: hypothetical protein PKX79_04880 [Spirochaetota bacterium]|jgi:hypothetical protein|nr:hypothetical protein [Spirochaetota bacterium]OQA97666.1 MAG: hypothetical protein BWY23_01423 [Spirochaetes bacterium ADurb.Bin218]HON16286.1 hypothetical protein [Spirochaetota bacterium]HOQ11388.1 hypothetical protein [Spirochaetota bacterium]HOV09530.1 hypothetical protein [Spirochaetota bacterium]
MHEYIPENNIFVVFLLILFTAGLYYFWWLARVSPLFGDDPVINILLTIFTLGLWGFYINLKYMQKSEMMNGRDMKWFMILFLPLSPVIIQHNINEKFFSDR